MILQKLYFKNLNSLLFVAASGAEMTRVTLRRRNLLMCFKGKSKLPTDGRSASVLKKKVINSFVNDVSL